MIWCFDAAGDKNAKFHTLGQALAVAGAEQGVAVDIQPDQHISIVTDADIPATCTANHALGTITYPATSDGPQKTGLLIYVRASTTAEDPWAVRGYADTSKTFPGDSTINQLFDYRHFDAYHLLGRTAAKAAWDNAVRINP